MIDKNNTHNRPEKELQEIYRPLEIKYRNIVYKLIDEIRLSKLGYFIKNKLVEQAYTIMLRIGNLRNIHPNGLPKKCAKIERKSKI